ncbi:hypothetical protein SAMN06265171_106295 [Chryseobacterium rhizoplanae]|uniref:Uncharacterized protein n=1 Tax=Chryseobacterium rhizoplanae TaxID=1609531 RepID=A0A521E1P6_9FLAO|nr:hypothetical protein [Chryseobacterium sediminis]SMO77876.1 hypothetical protein SAMN06265171_106295 [Chryseobacterium rhizoplanae]
MPFEKPDTNLTSCNLSTNNRFLNNYYKNTSIIKDLTKTNFIIS